MEHRELAARVVLLPGVPSVVQYPPVYETDPPLRPSPLGSHLYCNLGEGV